MSYIIPAAVPRPVAPWPPFPAGMLPIIARVAARGVYRKAHLQAFEDRERVNARVLAYLDALCADHDKRFPR